MPYWDIVGRSFRIAWQRRYLWLLAFFAGESGGSFSFSFNSTYQPSRPRATGTVKAPDFGAALTQVTAWIQQNLGLLLVVTALWLLLAIGFFVFGAACEAATIRAAAEHDAERPFGLNLAWQAGVSRMWVIVRFRLILLALGLPVFIVLVVLIVGAVVAGFNNGAGAAVALGVLAFLLFLAAIPYVIYLSFLDRLGSRAAVLELLAARTSLARAHHLLFKRLGRALLVWLLSIAVALGVGVVAGVALAVLFLPAIVLAFGAASGGLSWLWAVLAALIVLPLALVVGGFLSAQMSTYWTLAYRRMDVEYPPAYAYPPQPVPQP